MIKEIIINGFEISDKKSLYQELNNKLMQGEDWKLGESLDALNDVFYGGFGEIKGKESVVLVWQNFENNKSIFGKEFTVKFYQEKLKSPQNFNQKIIQEKIKDLENDKGLTYFDMILEIISTHSNIQLVMD